MIEQCIVRPCRALVEIHINANGGLPNCMAANGYTGLTDDGDAVCPDHFCPTCGNYHTDAAAFTACEFNYEDADLTPCGVRDPHAVLAAYAAR